MTQRFEDFELDTQRFELRRAGVRVPMEPQVFDVLALLVANRDRVVTKEELMDEVWGDRFISEAALNSRVMSARKALGDTGREQRLIRTVHGRGYRFIGEVTGERPREGAAAAASAAAAATAPRKSATTAAPALLGREDEMARLEEWFREVQAGRRRVVLISGEAGLGKTTLLQAFLSRLDPDAVSIAQGQCLDHRGEGEPYMPVLEALTRLSHSEGAALDEIRRLAPSWLLQMPGLVDADEVAALQPKVLGASRERMLREIVECLDAIAGIRPLVLVIEDLHWSDRSTLDVLSMIARRPEPAALLVIATYRPADASAAHIGLPALLRELTLRGYAEEISLGSLPPDAVQAYVRARAGVDLPPGVAEVLSQRTGGHPLYMSMVYEAWQAEGVLKNGSVEGLVERLEGPLPASVAAYINQRFSLLTGAERAVLEAASVVGREFSAAAIAPALGMPTEEVEAVCETLVRSGFFVAGNGDAEWPDGTVAEAYVFLHELYTEVLYAGIPASRIRRLHQEVGAALEAGFAGQERENAAALAVHFARGRLADKAVTYLRMAGEQALQRAADQEAAGHLSTALEFVPRLSPGLERDRAELLVRLELASALIPSRGWADQEVEALYKTALSLAEKLGDEALTSIALFGMATMYEVRGEYVRSGELMNRRLVLDSRPDSTAPVESLDLLACSEFHRGLFVDSLRHAEQGVALYRPEVPSRVAILGENPAIGCHDWAGLSSFLLGHPDQALRHVNDGLKLANEPENQYSLSLAHGQAAVLYQLRNEPQLAREHAARAMQSGHEYGFVYHIAWSGIVEAWARAILGECDTISALKDNMQRSLDVGARMDHVYYQGLLVDAYRACGDVEAALEVVDEALDTLPGNRRFFYEPELRRLKGLLLLERGGPDASAEAEKVLQEALKVASDQGARPFQLRAAVALLRLAEREQANDAKARELLSELVRSFEEGLDIPDLKEARALLEG
jgi:DNA-binding winged helix-turn-helix (wHTH) protein/tetratricopeptide (TPR) repeat protein